MGCVYLITHIASGRAYVGQTVDTVSKRWNGHVHGANRGDEYHFARAIAKYGRDAFALQELSHHDSQEDLDNAERVAMIVFSAQDKRFGFNIRGGGSRGKHAEQTKAKLRAARMNQVITPEMYQKGADKRRGLVRSVEHCAKLSAAHKGRPKTQSARAKMSESASRRIASGNHPFTQGKRYITGRAKGFHLSEEQKKSISIAQRSRHAPDDQVTPEVLDCRERQRRYRARKKAQFGC